MGLIFETFYQKKIEDQVIVITGATSGIGLATARMAARKSAKLVLASRNEEVLRRLCNEIRINGGQAVYQVADVSQPDEVARIADKAIEAFGGFDTWVNNAGVTMFGELMEVDLRDQRRLMEINFWGVVHGTLEAIRHMKNKGGSIINLGSVLSERALPLQGVYSASKHAVKAFTDTVRMELEKEDAKIAVTLLLPTSIATPLPEHARNYMEEAPKLVAPFYDPRVVAKAIITCSEKKVRDVIVGGAGGPFLFFFARLMPRVGDLFLRRRAYRLQRRKGVPPRNPEGNLYRPSKAEGFEHGSQTERIAQSSIYTTARLYPGLSLLAAIGAAGVAGTLGYMYSRRAQPSY